MERRISQLLYKIATKFQRLPHVFGAKNYDGTIVDTARGKGKQEIKDGDHLPEVDMEKRLSQLVHKIVIQFLRLSHILGSSNMIT